MFHSEILEILEPLNTTQRKLFWYPFFDSKFNNGYGSTTTSNHHHAYKGGLVVHTQEVILLADMLGKFHDCWSPELLISASWHDYGKIYDYDENGVKIPGRDKSSHIEDSVCELIQQSVTNGRYYNQGRIIGMIEAHHGKLEWGSLKVPETTEEKVLHMADYISAIGYNLDLNVLHTGIRD